MLYIPSSMLIIVKKECILRCVVMRMYMYMYVCGTISPLVLIVITKYDFYVKTSVIIT